MTAVRCSDEKRGTNGKIQRREVYALAAVVARDFTDLLIRMVFCNGLMASVVSREHRLGQGVTENEPIRVAPALRPVLAYSRRTLWHRQECLCHTTPGVQELSSSPCMSLRGSMRESVRSFRLIQGILPTHCHWNVGRRFCLYACPQISCRPLVDWKPTIQSTSYGFTQTTISVSSRRPGNRTAAAVESPSGRRSMFDALTHRQHQRAQPLQ
jgi:hypothetical protein